MLVSRESARQLMIEKQGVTDFPGRVDKSHIYETVDRLGCLQIDTIHVVERSHFLTLWSRLGCYEKDLLHEVAYRDRLLFEYYAHALSYIPFKDYRFYMAQMERNRTVMRSRFVKRSSMDPALIDEVYRRVADEGPLSSSDFEGPRTIDGWGNWKPAKLALELMYRAGLLLIHHRYNFQKYYDLVENMIPSNVDTSETTEEERMTFFALRTLKALGIAKPQEIRKYFQSPNRKLGSTKKLLGILDNMVSEGQVERHSVEGDEKPCYCLPADYQRLQELEAGNFRFDDVRLFIYFDSLLWIRKKVENLFGFVPRLEVFLPKTERVYGFYHLPVLYGDRLVARIEPKIDRKNDILNILGYWVEDGFKPTEDYEDKLHRNLDNFAQFHGAKKIKWQI
jgi:uncharacterized protein YcaQ